MVYLVNYLVLVVGVALVWIAVYIAGPWGPVSLEMFLLVSVPPITVSPLGYLLVLWYFRRREPLRRQRDAGG